MSLHVIGEIRCRVRLSRIFPFLKSVYLLNTIPNKIKVHQICLTRQRTACNQCAASGARFDVHAVPALPGALPS
jgi:transposase-like protein